MLSTKDRLAQFQKGSNNPPAATAPKQGQAGLKPVSKTNGGAAKPAESSVKPTEPKAVPAPATKPGEQPKVAAPNLATTAAKPKEEPKPAQLTNKPTEQAKPGAATAAKPVEQPKPAAQPAKPADQKPADAAKAAEPKPVEAAKPAPPKPAEQAKPVEPPKPAGPAKPAEQPKPTEPAKPAEQAKPAELPKPATQIAPPATKQEPQKPAETTAKPEAAAAPKPVEQPKQAAAPNAAKPVEQPKPAEPAKPAEHPKQVVSPAPTAQASAKPAEQPKPAEPAKVTEQPKPAVPQAAQPKPAEQPKPTEAAKQAAPVAAKAPEPSTTPAATVKPAEQKTVEVVVKTAQQPQTTAVAKPAEVSKPSEPVKTAEVPKQQTDAKAQPSEAKPASSDELFANIFYFSGMGSLIGSALAEGIYVPEKNHHSALELEEIELSKKREETKHKHEIITTARTQAQGLYTDFQKLQALLESLPTFTDALEPKPLERRAVDQPIHGHIYFQQEQQQRPQSPYHARQPASQTAHSAPFVDSTVTRRQQTTTYTSSQMIHPTANTTRIGLGRSPAEERSAISTIHVTETHRSAVDSPLRDSAAHSPIVAGFDRLAAKQDSLAKDAADRAAFNRAHGANALDPSAIHYPTIEPRYHPNQPRKHEMHSGHYQQTTLRSEATGVPGAHQQDAMKHHAGGGTLDTSDLKPWQLSHLRGLEVHGYHLESQVPPHHFSPTQHSRPFQPAPFVVGASSSDTPYCDL